MSPLTLSGACLVLSFTIHGHFSTCLPPSCPFTLGPQRISTGFGLSGTSKPVVKKSKTIGLHLDTRTMSHIFVILLVATACGGVIFNSTTVAMPKVFDERLRMLTETNVGIGALVAVVYHVGLAIVRPRDHFQNHFEVLDRPRQRPEHVHVPHRARQAGHLGDVAGIRHAPLRGLQARLERFQLFAVELYLSDNRHLPQVEEQPPVAGWQARR